MTALEKMNMFTLDPCVEYLLSVEEFEELTPHSQGFCTYIQADWDESGLKHLKNNPYPEGSDEFEEFKDGSFVGMFWAQDTEE